MGGKAAKRMGEPVCVCVCLDVRALSFGKRTDEVCAMCVVCLCPEVFVYHLLLGRMGGVGGLSH